MDRRSFLVTVGLLPLIEDPPTLLVGDSLAFMLAPPLRRTARRHHRVLKASARGGTNAGQWLSEHWFTTALRRYRPSTVLVSLGVNDGGVKINREKFPARVKRLVALAHERSVSVVWLLPPKMKPRTAFIREAVEKSGADCWHDASKLDIPLFEDHVHPTFKGLEIWAEDLGRFLWNPGT